MEYIRDSRGDTVVDVSRYLRIARDEDIPILLSFAKHFHTASNYKALPFNTSKGIEFLRLAIKSPQYVVLVALIEDNPIGFLVGTVNEPVFSSRLIAMELGWWIEPQHRHTRASALIYSAYEDWAKRVGADCIQGAYLPGVSPELDQFYKKRGYLQVESSYLKILKV